MFASTLMSCRSFSTSTQVLAKQSYKLVVVGGGAGGCTIAAKFCQDLPAGSVAIIEPSQTHYYQPLWTLVGGGLQTFKASARPMSDVLPKKAKWIKDSASLFNPEKNYLITASGDEITYEYLIIAMGIKLDYEKIKGLPEAFETPGVCSNYSPHYVEKTLESLKRFKEGNAIFTFPNTLIKCPGAPQKAMYISEEYLRNTGKRQKANIIYNSSLSVIFAAKKYADALQKVVDARGIHVNYRHELVEVKPDSREAVFRLMDDPNGTTKTFPYEMLHVVPPMSTPSVLSANKQLVTETGYLDVNKSTLQHNRFANIYGLGDCTSLPTPKTAAAIASQNKILYENLSQQMQGKGATHFYNGYTSCPLVIGSSTCILAEFDYDLLPVETLPVNQAKERFLSFVLKKHAMPIIYWEMMLNFTLQVIGLVEHDALVSQGTLEWPAIDSQAHASRHGSSINNQFFHNCLSLLYDFMPHFFGLTHYAIKELLRPLQNWFLATHDLKCEENPSFYYTAEARPTQILYYCPSQCLPCYLGA